MWKVAAAIGYCVRDADPSLGVRNRAAQGRSATWTEGEVGAPLQARMARRLSWPRGRDRGRVVDAIEPRRRSRPAGLATCHRAAHGAVFFTDRGKDGGKPVGGALSDRALAAVEAYVNSLGVELHGDAYIFRNRSGAPYSSDTLGDDFRDIRHARIRRPGQAHPGRLPALRARSRPLPATPSRRTCRTPWATPYRASQCSVRDLCPGERLSDVLRTVVGRPGRRRPRRKLAMRGTESVQKSEHDGPKSRNSAG